MTIILIGPGNVMAALIAIEHHFVVSEEPIILRPEQPGAPDIMVTGLPYFDENGNLELPFKETQRHQVQFQALSRLVDFAISEVRLFRSRDYENNHHHPRKPTGYKNKITKPSKTVNRPPIRTRTSC